MRVIFLVAELFWDLLYVSRLCHIIKLVSKIELKIRGIASGFIKERIVFIWANKTICQLDQVF